MGILEYFTCDMDLKGKSSIDLTNKPQSHIENVIFSFSPPCYKKKNSSCVNFSSVFKSLDHYSDLHFILFVVERI